MESEQRRALVAVVLSGIVLFAWQYFFVPKTPPAPITENVAVKSTTNEIDGQSGDTPTTEKKTAVDVSPVDLNDNKVYTLSREQLSVSFDRYLKIRNFSLIATSEKFENIVGPEFDFKITVSDVPLVIENFEKINESSSKGTFTNGDSFFLELDDKGKLKYRLTFKSARAPYITFKSVAAKTQANKERSFIVNGKDVSFFVLGNSSSDEANYKWFGVDHDYHLFVMTSASPWPARVVVQEAGIMTLSTSVPTQVFEGEFVYSKKNYDMLSALGSSLELSVDFGILGVIAVPILRGLQFFYKYIPNYGIAIILLTIVIRLITFPLQYKSFVSMKKMQVLQPELAKLKEKYKDDAPRLQKETMELFKRSGANPLGGCLPLLAQMPIFFAFYKVLYAAVELVGSPFYGWIHDLSVKDPIFVLPIIMIVLMFLQQKMTPSTTADPMQQRIMLLMPIVFGFIMKDLPSGLVLYICVSTLIGILQQMLVFKTAK
ncbi:MAG: membrane protein insertase YidC [Bdellovibrio sp.]|nr:membrane protein insertase YidC [Bdellovibrio sp.]